MGSENRVYPRRVVQDGVLILLRQAAANRDLHAGMVFLRLLQRTQGAVQALVGVLAHGTGVKYDEVRLGAIRRRRVAGLLEQAGNALGIMNVHLAAKGPHLIGAGLVISYGGAHVGTF